MVETDSLIILPPPSKCDTTCSVWTSHAIILYFREGQSINATRAMARLYVESRKADTWSSDTHVFEGITSANLSCKRGGATSRLIFRLTGAKIYHVALVSPGSSCRPAADIDTYGNHPEVFAMVIYGNYTTL